MSLLHHDSTYGKTIESRQGSAICSHRSYDPLVEGVCHHSGRYLTRGEINPAQITFLREQHDFPGFPELDRQFRKAVHAHEHQHIEWSLPGVQGVALLITGGILLSATALLFARQDQIASVFDYVLFYILVFLGSSGGLSASGRGIWLLAQRNRIYHQQAMGNPPATPDFPLFCSYEIEVHENLTVDLCNDDLQTSKPIQQQCQMKLTLHPRPDTLEIYQTYQRLYGAHGVGDYFHAGMIALENHNQVNFGSALEFDHRLVLRSPVPPAFKQQGFIHNTQISGHIPYTIHHSALYRGQNERCRFRLECKPLLSSRDSYTLMLQFRWQDESESSAIYTLSECRLNIPAELKPVEEVSFGRYDVQTSEVIWNNLRFTGKELTLTVKFGQPVLSYCRVLTGIYTCRFNGLVSGMRLVPAHVWNALGRRVIDESTPVIRRSSQITGNLQINPRKLAQDHENVSAASLHGEFAPDHLLVTNVIKELAANGVDILRIEQATPRLDPAGTLGKQLYYWDIVGRRYEIDMLDAADVHLVITGFGSNAAEDGIKQCTHIDLRVRYLHDPRNVDRASRAEGLCNHLKMELQQKLTMV